MGKYDGLLSALPREVDISAYQQKVEARKAEFGGVGQPAPAARRYRELRDRKDELEDLLSVVNLDIAAAEQLLHEAYEHAGITSVKLDDGSSVRIQFEPVARIEDREAFRRWCLENGLEAQLMLPYQTTNSLVKERLLDGEPEPSGVKTYVRTKTVLTR
jgi:hypothetical protein